MDAKFKKIASFLETLPVEKVLDTNEGALFLVGGNGDARSTNNGCVNNSCKPDPNRLDNNCTNNGCINNNCGA